MNILITGVNGIVGTAILDEHGGNEHYVFRGLDIENNLSQATTVAIVTEYDAIRSAFERIDAAIHLAVYSLGFTDENWERILAIKVEGTRIVLRAAVDARSSR